MAYRNHYTASTWLGNEYDGVIPQLPADTWLVAICTSHYLGGLNLPLRLRLLQNTKVLCDEGVITWDSDVAVGPTPRTLYAHLRTMCATDPEALAILGV
jgi:hypothetical protein